MYRVQCVILITFCCCYYRVNCDVVRNEDICGPHNGRRLYLELGEKGILFAKNVSLVKSSPRQHQATRIYVTNSSHDQCSLELVTCPSCVITLTFKSLALSHHCSDGGIMMDSPCRCDYVWISEPPYEDVSGTPYCGLYSPITYRSSTRTLSIALLYSQTHRHAFTLEYTAERNRIHLKGTSAMPSANAINNTGGGILMSPFFPARYPRDLGMEYIVTCPTEAPSCRVRVLFSDFQLATVSIMEFYDWNGQRLDVSSGARFRPPVIVSSGPSLLIRFYANGGTGLGYKAFYSFVLGHMFDKTVSPITDCGGYVENLGGAITMMDMVGQGLKTYDCVWLIRPPKNFLHMKTHMYLKVVTFADMAGNTELTIKQGPTSALLPLEVLRHPASQLQPPRLREHVAPVTSGFHVSLRGTFGPTSRVAIAYAAFSYMDCFTGSDFLCQNHRCIPSQLNCDGFDHCGDNSDEPSTCFRDWEVEPQDRKWHMNKANYYFPKIDRYPDLKTATLVFVASSLGLIILISALIILLYRMGARARQQRELQSRLQTISELLDGARIDEITVSDDPPVYEAPPGYDEVVKVGMDGIEVTRRRKRRNLFREPRSRSSPNQRSRELEGLQTSLVEGVSTSRSSQTTPISEDAAPRVPESPPPPYVTPPGTIPRNLDISSLPRLLDSAEAAEEVSPRGQRLRTAWLRTGLEHSRSLPAVDKAEAPPFGGPSTSVDAEALGAYLQNYASSRPPIMAATSINPSAVPLRSINENRQSPNRSMSLEVKSSSSSSSATATCANDNSSQPNDCRVVSTLMRRVYGENACVIGNGKVSRIINVLEAEAESQRQGAGLAGSAIVAVDRQRGDHEDVEIGPRESCACAGACGCAVNEGSADGAREDAENHRKRPKRRKKHRSHDQQGRTSNDGNNNNSDSNNNADLGQGFDMEIKATENFVEDRKNDEGEMSIPKSAIIRLLGSSRSHSRNSQTCSLNSTTHSTACSTPNGTYGRSYFRDISNPRKVSVCSKDSRMTALSFVSSTHSNERLHDDFEIVSEKASILGDENSSTLASSPIGTPKFCGILPSSNNGHNGEHLNSRRKRRPRSRNRRASIRYSSCDIDSLHESIQTLDTFLARRGLNVNQTGSQSVAVMLFGTPEHTRTRVASTPSSFSPYPQEPNEATGFINSSKNWRSSDDAFSN
ncbi:uncharacterized protein Culd isoform X2 [Venturia canescens]|uniref:uncharacterized protein Culd isoform X2 n=1 Tax=Venturia canescens TaxID=32260 RepID=UPI001C9C7478|nr:uncharacterized protein LOC122407736 isoform X2 [Venturia canescens]